MGVTRFVANSLLNVYIFSWDLLLAICNLVLPNKPVAGHPENGGKWPEYVPRKEGDSRCSCPALNALANHGILPHDGKNIRFTELNRKVRATYNFAPTFTLFVPNFAASFLNKSYSKDTFDLQDLDLRACCAIEHDASLVRVDVYHNPDQSQIAVPLVKQLLAYASGKDEDGNPLLLAGDVSKALSQRRVDAESTNPNFSLYPLQKAFGSANASTLLTIFGGRVDDIRSVLLDERLPENWESKNRSRFGLTFLGFNSTVFKVTAGINTKNLPPSKDDGDS